MKSTFLWACLIGGLALATPTNSHAQQQMDPCPAKRIYINGNYLGLSLSDSLPAQINGDYSLYFFSEYTMCEIVTGFNPVFVTGNFSTYFPDAVYEPGTTNIGIVFDISGSTSCPGITTNDLRQQATVIAAVRTVPWTVLSFTMIDGELQECSYDTTETTRLSLLPAGQAPTNYVWTTASESIVSPYFKQRTSLIERTRKAGCPGKTSKTAAPGITTRSLPLP